MCGFGCLGREEGKDFQSWTRQRDIFHFAWFGIRACAALRREAGAIILKFEAQNGIAQKGSGKGLKEYKATCTLIPSCPCQFSIQTKIVNGIWLRVHKAHLSRSFVTLCLSRFWYYAKELVQDTEEADLDNWPGAEDVAYYKWAWLWGSRGRLEK